jgi:hypothetical protein
MEPVANTFMPELYAGLLLDQNREEDVFDVWVGNEAELKLLAFVFEQRYNCAVIPGQDGFITVCLPFSDAPPN